jgi:signal transduction histidine kinase
MVRPDGITRWIRARGEAVGGATGRIVGLRGTVQDITERKLAEEVLSTASQKLIEAQEQERSRLARELHDDINQRIAMLAFNLERLKQDLPSPQAELRRRIANECTRVRELGRDIQALSHRLHSSKLEYLGLVGAARGFCAELADLEHVEIDFRSENVPEELPKETSLCLFRILQEALQNAVKHSGSRHFQVSLGVSLNRVELTVHDSGIGFKPEGAIKGRGLGLTSMKERLKLIDGQLSIESQLGAGATIRATAPLCFGSEPLRTESRSLKAQKQSA